MKTIVGIATKGDRPHQLRKTLDSLYSQADLFYLQYNNTKWEDVPDCLKRMSKVHILVSDYDYTDNGKFCGLELIEEDSYYFSVDDDIIYPKDYVKVTKKHLKNWQIVTYHGRILMPDAKLYYGSHKEFFFNGTCEESILDVAGTGVTAIDTHYFKPNIAESKYKRMSDLVFSLEAKKAGLPIYMAAHKQHWLVPQVVESSIFRERGDQTQQVELVNKILKL